jgi:succinate dehydrogenase / fumarate reductase iron-sulfur subunit
MNDKRFVLRIWRGHPGKQYWEEFELQKKPGSNIISALMEIQRNPTNREGKKVEPVVWEAGCLEEVCGLCSMLINGKPRQACTALIDPLLEDSLVITLAPLAKFPLVRDLIVDRSRMFENLKTISGWIEADSLETETFGPKIPPKTQELMYRLSRCISCGCCLESCPQVNSHSPFQGPAVIAQVRLFNIHPKGRLQKRERLAIMMKEGGVSGCGNAQNCVRVCPKELPLTESIADINKETTLLALRSLFGRLKEQ